MKLGSRIVQYLLKMNTSIKFKQPVMRLERVVNNRDAEEVFCSQQHGRAAPGCDEKS
jgi:hypothetical protein